jgi:hypothetical protein
MSEWTGDLTDDCVLLRYGMMAHAEQMDRARWWFAVYSDEGRIGSDDLYNTADNQTHVRLRNGKEARAAAECVLELLHASRAADSAVACTCFGSTARDLDCPVHAVTVSEVTK